MKSGLILRTIDDYETSLHKHYGFIYFESTFQQTYSVPSEIGKGSITNIYPNNEL